MLANEISTSSRARKGILQVGEGTGEARMLGRPEDAAM